MIPAVDSENRLTLRRGAVDDLVELIQTKIGVPATGRFDAGTEAAVRQFQRDNGLVPDGHQSIDLSKLPDKLMGRVRTTQERLRFMPLIAPRMNPTPPPLKRSHGITIFSSGGMSRWLFKTR